METLFAVLVGGILIPIGAWRFVGARRLRDPYLIPLLGIALAFALPSLIVWITVDGPLDWKFSFGLLAFAVFLWRWKSSRALPPPAS